jgi:outer membrane protein assembly factor BamB
MKVSIKTFLVLSLMVTLGLVVFLSCCWGSSGGKSGYSNEASATPSASAPPLPPTNLTATAGNEQVTLTWNASIGATSYNVYESTTSGGPYTKINSTKNTSYTVTGLTNGTTYYFVVTTVNSAGESGYSNEVSATPVPCSYSINPTGQSFTSTGGSGSISVIVVNGCNWNATSNVSGITITSGSSGSGNGTVNYSVAANDGSSCRIGTITVADNTFNVVQAGRSASGLECSPWPKFRGNIQNTGLSSIYTSADTGTLKWSYTTGYYIFSSPAIGADGTIYVGSLDNNLYAINPNGTLKWSYKTGGSIILSSPAIGADGTIYVGSLDNNLYAINPNGTLKWSYKTGDWINSSPAIGSDGTIYVGSYDHKLYAINPNGTLKWSFTTGSWIESSSVIGADGTIYVGSADNNLYAIH